MAAAAAGVEFRDAALLARVEHATSPIKGQKPGTSGLRKKTAVFEGESSYLPNFIQATLSALGEELKVRPSVACAKLQSAVVFTPPSRSSPARALFDSAGIDACCVW
jgi:hypothetical protein